MIQVDKVLIDFFKHFFHGCKFSFANPNTPNLRNNIFIPPEIIILDRDYKLINIIVKIANNKQQPDQSMLNTLFEMLNSLSSKNIFTTKDDKKVTIVGIPIYSDFVETNNARLTGFVSDFDISEQNEKATTYNVSIYLKAISD